MTEDVADRPVLSHHQRSEAFDRAVAIMAKGTKRFEYPTIPKVPFAEQYNEGTLQIACVLDWPSMIGDRGFSRDGDDVCRSAFGSVECDGSGIDQIDQKQLSASAESYSYFGREKQLVLIRDVQFVKVVQGKFAAGKGLHFAPDKIECGGAGLELWGMSFDGAFRLWPAIVEGELDLRAPLPTVVLDHDPVRVIQTDAQVMDDISDDEGGAIGEGQSKLGRLELPRIWVEFAPHGFEVRLDVSSKSFFKLADVMIGPFYFEKRPSHSEIVHA